MTELKKPSGSLELTDRARFGDAVIVEHARVTRARPLTLDRKQSDLLGDQAILVE